MPEDFAEIVRQILEEVRAQARLQRRRRRRLIGIAAMAAAMILFVALAVTLAVLTVNAGKPPWAVLVLAVVMAFGFLSGIYFVAKDLLDLLRRRSARPS